MKGGAGEGAAGLGWDSSRCRNRGGSGPEARGPAARLLPNLIINTATPSTILCKTSFTKFGARMKESEKKKEKKWGARAASRGRGLMGPSNILLLLLLRRVKGTRSGHLNYHHRLFKKCPALRAGFDTCREWAAHFSPRGVVSATLKTRRVLLRSRLFI